MLLFFYYYYRYITIAIFDVFTGLYSFGQQIIPLISDHLKLMASVDWGDF